MHCAICLACRDSREGEEEGVLLVAVIVIAVICCSYCTELNDNT